MANTGGSQGNHDEFVARCFQDLELARAFFHHYLPAEILEQIDLERVSLEEGSFVDEDLRRSYSDLNYAVPLRKGLQGDEKSRAYIYILVEHKSASDEFTVFQLLRYMVRIWQRELEAAKYRSGFRLPPIVPLVLHHGRTRFRAPVDFRDLVVSMPGVDAFVPQFRCLLVDLMSIGPDELPESEVRLCAVLGVMRSVFGEEIDAALRDAAIRLATILDRPETKDTLAAIMTYVLQSAGRMTDARLAEAIQPLGRVGVDAMSTLIERWKEEGRLEGREEGRVLSRQETILEILTTRFERVPEPVSHFVRGIFDLERLARLTAAALKCDSLDQFAESLK
ncbi:MAG: Rpn family recombination-promoting nuclease/putative transposase [Planctomycetaceae bacterium]|nr:Rpn family recombination-promoting nuclease/putative transposase [Planctomycetaceae bacterium]